MQQKQLEKVKEWFYTYTGAYADEQGRFVHALQTKFDHSHRVAELCREIAERLNWAYGKVIAAETLGLLHDVGRFSQYEEFGSFRDAFTINHGQRGYEVLANSIVPNLLDSEEVDLILSGVRYHNSRTVPELDGSVKAFVDLVRDSDKLDIFSIIREIVETNRTEEFLEAFPDLEGSYSVTEVVLEQMEDSGTCLYKSVRTFGDLQLLQLSWIKELVYPPALAIFKRQNIVDFLESILPKEKRVKKLLQGARDYLVDL